MSFVRDPWGLPVRATDPDTSGAAAVSTKQYNGTQRSALLHAFNHETATGTRDMTGEEAAYRAIALGYHISLNSYWKRISELQNMGLIQESGKTRATSSGRQARCFVITLLGQREWASAK